MDGRALYLYNFLFLTFFLFLCERKVFPKRWYKNIVIFYFIFIFGQRWSAGVDFFGYLKYYLIHFPSEIGYRTIERFFFYNNIYFGLLIFLIYLFTTLGSLWFLRKFTASNYAIYFFFLSEYHIMSINPLRTYIAINFFLIALYKLYFNKKKISALLFIILGSLFHKIIIFTLPFFLFIIFLEKVIKKKKLILWLILFIIPIIPSSQLLKLMVVFIPVKYLDYIGSVYDVPLSILNIARYYIILIFYIYLYPKKIKNEKFSFIDKMILTFILITSLSVSFAPLHRIAYFFKMFELLYFIYIFERSEKIYKKIFILIFFIMNYFFISYKDMGVLRDYKLEYPTFKNQKSMQEYFKEVEVYEAKNENAEEEYKKRRQH